MLFAAIGGPFDSRFSYWQTNGPQRPVLFCIDPRKEADGGIERINEMDWKAFFGNRIFKLASAATFAASFYLVQPYRPVVFVGKSMANTYKNNEIALGTTDVRNLAVGDVVVIEYEGSTFVKRIAHMPGDKVEYTKIAKQWVPTYMIKFGTVKHPDRFKSKTVTIPSDEVYVLGDNLPVSIDSRQIGTIPIDAIRSKLIEPKPQAEAPDPYQSF